MEVRRVFRSVWLAGPSLVLWSGLAACRGTPPQPVEAIATLTALLSVANSKDSIEIPDAKITLLNANNAQVAQGLTDLDGHFRITAPAAGTYTLCWNVQGDIGCRREVVLKDPETFLGVIGAPLKGPLLYGQVLTGDKRPCWVRDPFFKVNVATKVDVTDAQNAAAASPVRANVHGYYLFVMKQPGVFNVHAQCEAAEQKATASLREGLARVDLTFPNHAPRIVELATRAAGQGTVRVTPSTAMQLTATVRDRDADPVEYLWRDADGQTPAAATDSHIARNAPASAGLQTTYLLARDGRGGYAYRRYDIEVGDAQVQFSGTVLDEVSHAPVVNAKVEFGTTSATTNSSGWFSVSGPVASGNRYVVNVRHPDYALYSRVFDRSTRSNVIELIRAQVSQVSIDSPVTLVDTNSSGPCGTEKGSNDAAGQVGVSSGNHAVARQSVVRPVEYVDAEPSVKYKPLDAAYFRKLTAPRGDCRHLGAQITMPAGALEDANGNRVTGSVRMAIATLDPTRRALPGDARAVDSSSLEAELLSYGAMYAEFRNSTNQLLKLRSGTTAEVTVPVPMAQRSTAKATIDFWSYDEASGKWKFESKAVLKSTPAGPVYVGKTTHFSYLNMDVAGTDPAVATCVRFELDPAFSSWSNLRVRSTVSYNGNQVITKETALNSEQYHAIYRIPFGTAFPPNTLRLELFGEFNGQSVALVDNVINTDLRPKMTGTDLWPPYPYSECGTPIVLAPASGVVPEYLTNDASNRPYFLTGPSGSFLPDDGETIATNYYATIGATAGKPTMGQWWTANTFGADGTGGTRAAYLNYNDLGFGRDMHCKKNGSKLACYVTNYGGPNQVAANADAALNQDASQRGATVAMEFSGNPNDAESVQFYVYTNKGSNAADPFGSAGLLKFADLDGFGPKPVPHLCLVCHGGSPTNVTNASGNAKAQHSRFREFDLPSFHYPANATWNFGQAVPPQINMTDFGTLNQGVRDAAPAAAPIRLLIEAWYPGGFAVAPQLPTPPGNAANAGDWANAANVDGYHQVYGQSCRTCHVARDGGSGTGFSFSTKSQFASTSYAVCGKSFRVMPNAVITFKNFWIDDPLRVTKYELLTGYPAGTCAND